MLKYKKWTKSMYMLINANGFRENGQRRLQCNLFLFYKIKVQSIYDKIFLIVSAIFPTVDMLWGRLLCYFLYFSLKIFFKHINIYVHT